MADIPDDEARRIAEELNRNAREAAVELQRSAEANVAKTAAINAAKNGLNQVGQGLISFSKATVDGSAGMSKYGQAIEEASSGVGDIAKALGRGGVLGSTIGLFISVVGKLVGSVLQNNDIVIEGYDKLAEMGGATAFNTQELMNLADAAKWPVTSGQFTTLVDVIREFGSDVTGIGVTAGDGIKNFMQITRVEEKVREEFNKLGIGQKKLAQLQAAYLSTEVKLGNGKVKSNETLRKESLGYIKNLVELSALTGQSIDEIKKKREQDLKDIGYNLALQRISQQENGKVIVERIKQVVDLAGEVDETSRRAVMDVVSKNFQSIGPAAAALEMRFGQAALNFAESVKDAAYNDGKLNEFRRKQQKAIIDTNAKQGDAMSLAVNTATDVFGMTSDTNAYLSKDLSGNVTDMVNKQVNGAKDREDDLKKNQTAMQDATTALSTAFDEFIKLISGPVNAAFRGLLYGVEALSKGILKFITRFKQVFSFGKDFLGKADPKIPYMLSSVDDLFTEQKEANAEILRIEKKFAEKGLKIEGGAFDKDVHKQLSPEMLYERYQYLDAIKAQEGIREQLKSMLGTDEYKKQLEIRQKNLNDNKSKEEALNKDQPKANEKNKEEALNKDQPKANEKNKQPAAVVPTAPSTNPASSSSNASAASGKVDISTDKAGSSQQAGPNPSQQKFMRGGIAQNPNNAKSMVSNMRGNAKIPLPSGVDIPADISLSQDFLTKLAESNGKGLHKDMFATLSEVMKNVKIDTMPANFNIGRDDLLKDSDSLDGLMSSYTEVLKKNIDTTMQLPNKTTDRAKENNINDIMSVIVNKMDLLASRMNENAEVQYTTLLSNRR